MNKYQVHDFRDDALVFYIFFNHDGKVATNDPFERFVVKCGKCAMLFERPDKLCCIPHLRRRRNWQSVLFDWASNSLHCIQFCDKSTELAEEFKARFEDALDAESLEVPLLRSLQPIEPSLECFWLWMWWSHKLCNVSYKVTQILKAPYITSKHETLRIRNL